MDEFTEHLTNWMGGPPTLERFSQTTIKTFKKRKIQVDAYQIGIMKDQGNYTNIRILGDQMQDIGAALLK